MAYFPIVLFANILVQLVTCNQSHEELCAKVNAINCKDNYKQQPDEALCASNGETYINRCFFVQAKCQETSISIVCRGNCTVCINKNKTDPSTDGTTTRTNILSQASSGSFSTTDPIIYNSLQTDTKETAEQMTDHSTTDRLIIQHQTESRRKLSEKLATTTGLTMQPSTTMSSFEERLRNITGVTINRKRKHQPGHHVDQITETTNEPIAPAGTMCINGDCMPSTTPQTNTNTEIDCSSKDCSSVDSSTNIAVTQATDSILLTVLTKSTYKTEKDSTKQTTIMKMLTKYSDRPDIATTQHVISSIKPTEDDFLLFCINADAKVCPKTLDPLCGTDNTFYLNICTFNKAKCKNRNLGLQADLGTCRRRSRI